MPDQGRLSIWKGEAALDSWYNAAVNRKASLRNTAKSDMDEMLFFDIAKSNQVKHPSGAANDWFYGATMGNNAAVGSRFYFTQTCSIVYLTLPSTCSPNCYNFTYVEWSWLGVSSNQVELAHQRQAAAATSQLSKQLCSKRQRHSLLRLYLCQRWCREPGPTRQAQS
jgi:hypothetical protein